MGCAGLTPMGEHKGRQWPWYLLQLGVGMAAYAWLAVDVFPPDQNGHLAGLGAAALAYTATVAVGDYRDEISGFLRRAVRQFRKPAQGSPPLPSAREQGPLKSIADREDS